MAGLKKTHVQFRASLRMWEEDEPRPEGELARDAWETRKALYAAWWFIENVGEDDPARTDIFFEVREIAREALWGSAR